MPTLDALLKLGRNKLKHLETPALDARLLLQHATGFTHAEIIAFPEKNIDAEKYIELIGRRAKLEPVSRIIGSREFYGRNFKVTPAVLDPRADTEVLIEAVLSALPPHAIRLLDLGTGSGIIAVTLLAERSQLRGVAVDVSAEALAVALQNAKDNGVADRLDLLQSSWFENVEGGFDAIVSNPPYIESSVIPKLDVDVRDHDPHVALDGGDDGLGCYRAIAGKALAYLRPEGIVAVEIGWRQAQAVTSIFASAGFELLHKHADLSGHDRCLVFKSN
jgi:release factor glutamine methyltransferase